MIFINLILGWKTIQTKKPLNEIYENKKGGGLSKKWPWVDEADFGADIVWVPAIGLIWIHLNRWEDEETWTYPFQNQYHWTKTK